MIVPWAGLLTRRCKARLEPKQGIGAHPDWAWAEGRCGLVPHGDDIAHRTSVRSGIEVIRWRTVIESVDKVVSP